MSTVIAWRTMIPAALGRCAGLVLGATLLWAGFVKMAAPERFVDVIARFDLVGPSLVDLVGAAVTVTELLVGAALAIGWRRRAMASVATGLVVAFAIVVAVSTWRGVATACGCFGDPSASSPGWIAARNAALAGLGLLATMPTEPR
jgi:uncharacterized membrane protein YphA (DoxX/SURF4 family)